MLKKTYNIHEILEFANRAEFTIQELDMNYEEEIQDLAKRGIHIGWDDDHLFISPNIRKAQIGSGIFTIGEYPEIPPSLEDIPPLDSVGTGMSVGYTDEDGKEHRFRMHLPAPKEWLKTYRNKHK